MKNTDKKKEPLCTDEDMLKKILLRECGNTETDEFAADELEAASYRNEEFAADNPAPGESEYFSTCEYTMIPKDDNSINCQGS